MEFCDELDVISVTPAMRPSWRSSGVATDVAMVSGLAPGSDAWTTMVGKSTCGRGETGSRANATRPASAMPKVRSVVAMGRLMKSSEGLPSFMICLFGFVLFGKELPLSCG